MLYNPRLFTLGTQAESARLFPEEKMAAGKISILCHYSAKLPYSKEEFLQSIKSFTGQNYKPVEVVVVDDRGKDAEPLDFLPSRVKQVRGDFKNHAAKVNAGLQVCTGKFVLLVHNESSQVVLKKNALDVMAMAMNRSKKVSLVYGDYERIDPSGELKEVHLLYHHPGRLRDTVDFGSALLIRAAVLKKIGGLDESYNAADMYDLRLKCSEGCDLSHIGNRYSGSLYTVKAAGKGQIGRASCRERV